MNKLILNKNKKNEKILYLQIVNCEDIKIMYYNNKPYDFTENSIYYNLDKNILKIFYLDDNIENVYFFTDTEKKKIKNKCLKMFIKEYNKFNNTEYKIKQLEKIYKYMEVLKNEKK